MSQHQSFQKYFLAISIPEPENEFLTEIKRRYHPHHRLSSPPHITLKPPFKMPNLSYLLEKLQKVARTNQPFSLSLDMIGSFHQPKYGTVFLEPQQGQQLKLLANQLSDEIAFLPTSNSFHPHLTLAQRVPHDDLAQVKNELRALNLKLNLEVKSFTLYTYSSATATWDPFQEFPFV